MDEDDDVVCYEGVWIGCFRAGASNTINTMQPSHTHTCDVHDAACGVMIVGHVVRPSCRVVADAMSPLRVRSSQTLNPIYY